jgi:hypothetical protein
MKTHRALLLVLTLAITGMGQIRAPQVPADEARKAGMTNIGSVLLPEPIGSQYYAAIDPTTGFGYFGSMHSGTIPAVLSKIDLRGPLPKVVQDGLPSSMPKEVGRLTAVGVDYSDPDPLKHYVYVAGWGQILKMAPGDATHAPQVVATLRPTSASGGFNMGLIDTSDPDPARHYAYFSVFVRNQPSKVLRVRLSDFSDQGAVTLQIDNVRFGALDTVRHYAYFTNFSPPGHRAPPQLCKVNLTTFRDGGTSVATYTMDRTTPGDGVGRVGFEYPAIDEGLVIDEKHGYAYIATYTMDPPDSPKHDQWPFNQSMVIRVKLGQEDAFPPHPLEVLNLRVGERNLSAGVIDVAHGNVYFGTDNAYPGHVYMIHVGDGTTPMREVGRLDLNLGSMPLKDMPRDGVTVGAIAALYGPVFLRSAILDAKRNAIYFGTDSGPGMVVKVGINGTR